jgi:mycothiol synthase
MDAELRDLIERARAVDGNPPFSDGALVELERGERQLVRLGDATALATGDSAEFVVDPDARGHGEGAAMLELLLRRGPGGEAATTAGKLFWAHGDHPAARALARRYGLEPVRELLQLRAEVPEAGHDVRSNPITGFRVGVDEDAWVEVNARTFAEHPEQGAVTREDLETLEAEPWFDPSDFLLLWEGGNNDSKLIGYCWLKLENGMGEFYAVGVDPQSQGRGLGRVLVEAGLARLAARGIRESLLYVEADNAAALRLYRSFGFREHSIDVQYRWLGERESQGLPS